MFKKAPLIASLISFGLSQLAFAHSQPDAHQNHYATQHAMLQAQHKMGKGGTMQRLQRALAQLALTDQQKQSIQSIKQENQQTIDAARDAIRPLKQQMRQLMADEDIDAAQVKELAVQIAEKKAEQLLLMASVKKQILAVLSAEQKAELERIKEKRQQRINSRISD